jgi:predicted SPOUT superfamily RNA methylase MTH1
MQHQPDRLRVKKSGPDDYYGYCVHCHRRIRRLRRNNWVRTRHWPEAIADQI